MQFQRSGRVPHLAAEGSRLLDFDWRKPRPAEIVMHPERLAACFPGALSFARTLFVRFAETPWKIEKLRVEFDAEGRGELLYRLSDGVSTLHFMVISNNYSAEDKADRSYNMNWDGTAALCEGEWSPEREEFLRREIPKQRFGRLDHQTLAYTRGNRSGRIFDHVVESLAEGRQPDGSRLAAIGYIFRTTGFTANGFISMRSYLGMDEGHLLEGPYHAQMCSAFLMREYVADLVSAMARARNPNAARLSPEMRRYLGIGNSAGLGLTPFVCNHPQMVHRWTLRREEALAAIRSMPAQTDDPAVARFRELVQRAQRYFIEDPRDGNEIFLPYEVISHQMGELLRWFDAQPDRLGDIWIRVASWVEANLQFETIEAVNVILLELYPDITRSFSGDLTVDEALDFDPAATVGDLRGLIDSHYAWMTDLYGDVLKESPRFWYMSTEAPYEPRVGYRGALPDYEFESHMDVPLRFGWLRGKLDGVADATSLASFLLANPQLRNVVTRLWTLRDSPYADLHDNTLREDYETFAATRFMLSHYGMDKLDAASRSVRGVLLQGAPIAEDLEKQQPGVWPFPLAPGMDVGGKTAEAYRAPKDKPATALKKLEVWKETTFGDNIVIAPVEMLRWAQRSLQVAGAELGHAIRGADLLHLREILFQDGMKLALATGKEGTIGLGPVIERKLDENVIQLEPGLGESSVLVLQSLLDFACHAAASTAKGTGIAFAGGIAHPTLCDVLPVWADQRGYGCAVLSRDGGDWRVVASSGRGAALELLIGRVASVRSLVAEAPEKAEEATCIVVCWVPQAQRGLEAMSLERRIGVAEHVGRAYRHGLHVSLRELEELRDIAFRTLIPIEREAPVSTE